MLTNFRAPGVSFLLTGSAGPVYVRTLLDEKLTKTRMSVEGSHVEIVVFTQGLKRLSVSEQKLDGADVTVVGAPLKERYAVPVCRTRRVARGHVFVHQVGAPVCNTAKYVVAQITLLRTCR